MSTARHLLVPSVAAARHRQHDYRAGRRSERQDAGERASRASARPATRSTAVRPNSRRRCRRTLRSTDQATLSASTRAPSSAPSPRPWITNFESQLPRRSRVLRRGFPLALHAGSARRLAPQAARLAHPYRAAEDRVRARHQPRRPRRAVHRPSPTARRCRPPDELWAWAHVHFNQSLAGASDGEHVSPDMGAVLAAGAGDHWPEPRPRLLAPRLPAPARRQHRLSRLRRADLRDRAASRHRPGPDARRRTPQIRPGDGLCRAARADLTPVYYRWYFRTGSEGDFEYLVTLLKPQPVDARVGTRDIDVLDPGLEHSRHCRSGLGGVLRLGGALQVPDAGSRSERPALRSAKATRTGTNPTPTLPDGARRVHQPARRLCGTDCGVRRYATSGFRPASPTIPIR